MFSVFTVEVGCEPYGTGENMHAVMRLRGSSKFVGVASVSFLDLLAPLFFLLIFQLKKWSWYCPSNGELNQNYLD